MAGDDPPFLPVGTEVSAKYRGAFCEAKVKKVVKCVKCKIFLKETQSSVFVTDENVKGLLKNGATVELKNPETGLITEGVISKLTDSSMYTVVFDDGDEKTLRRTQLCLKGEKHFIESETLDNLPLSHPEHFGTPVINKKTKRGGRPCFGTDDDDADDTSSDESLPKRAEYKGRLRSLVGKVMLTEMGEKRKQQVPVLVVLPDAHSTELRTKDHLLVKSFKDGKFYAIARKDMKEFSKDTVQKNEDKSLKAAFEKAISYYDNQDLPSSWERDELLGTDEEENSDDEESSDDEPSEEKDRFVAQLYKFMDDRGTPINKGPTLLSKDLNLYRLFKVVQNFGGYNKVTNQLKWRGVYAKMDLPPSNTASHQIKTAYKKYLHAFEDFYRKLGSSMGTISRPGRSRNNSGRGIHVPFKKGKESEKKEDSKDYDSKSEVGDDEEEKESQDTPTKRDRSPAKRVMRHDVVAKSDEKIKKDEPKEKKVDKDESTPKKAVKKDLAGKKDEIVKKTAKTVKKEKEEEKKAKKESEDEKVKEKEKPKEKEKDKESQEKKVVRRRSMRKDEKDPETKMEEDVPKEDEGKKEKSVEKDTKSKSKPVIRIEKTDKKEERKEEKKEEKSKITRKDIKKLSKPEEESQETEKHKAGKKDVKKAKSEEEKPEENDSEKSKGPIKKEVQKKDEHDNDASTKKETKSEKVKVEVENDEEEAESNKKGSEEEDYEPLINAEYPNGTKLQVRYGRGRNQKVYDAKVVEAGLDGSQVQYLVHYAGWNMRYDEWIKPERIVNVLNRPDIDRDKKLKDCSPKTSKPQIPLNKKRGRPGSTPPQVNPPKPSTAVESRPAQIKAKSPGTATKPKSRPTRSNSVEFKVLDGLPPKIRRTRRSSGVTESDVNSQGSDVDDSDQSEVDPEEKEDMSAGSPDIMELEKDTSVDSDDEEDKKTDISLEEMPKLERKVDEPELPCLQEVKNKADDSKSDSKDIKSKAQESDVISVTVEIDKPEDVEKDSPECAPKLEAEEAIPELGVDPVSKELPLSNDNTEKSVKEVFKWDIEEESEDSETKTNEVVTDLLETIQSESDDVSEVVDKDKEMPPVTAPVLEKQGYQKEELNIDMDKPAPEIKPEIIKSDRQDKPPASDIFDKFEFRDDEEEITLPDLRAEAEKELKEKLKQEAEIEKRINKGKKKEIKEKKEVKKGKLTMAERKMVILPEGTPQIEYEPPMKKMKEVKPVAEKVVETASDVSMSSLDKVISSVCDKAREFVLEETESEKKKVKKKVKKKGEVDVTSEVKKETKKELVKGLKPPKLVTKGKGKKNKDTGEGDTEQVQDIQPCTSTKMEHEICPATVSSSYEIGSSKTKTVIKSDSAIDGNVQIFSGVELLSGIALMKASETGGDGEGCDITKEGNSSSVVNTVIVNTPPTTPEHDDSDSAQCTTSQDHSSSSQESQHKSDIDNGAESGQQLVGGESPQGNASPSSNDGSVSSGNVACSESSNTDVPVSSNLGKRRKESEEPTPTKKKRKGKSKGTSERKMSKTAVGSDSDEVNGERRCSPDPRSSPTKSANFSGAAQSPRPSRYNLNLEEGKYLEGEKRIAFLMEKIQEIRKVYMNLKAEVACIDRRRKRARRKDSVHHSSTAAETECCR